jgi:aspartokinase
MALIVSAPSFQQGTGMVAVPGIASAIFSTVRDANINVIMISQVRQRARRG